MTRESPEGPATYGWLAALAITLAFGIVGRMDYEDALAQERMDIEKDLARKRMDFEEALVRERAEGGAKRNLLCRRFDFDSTVANRGSHPRDAVVAGNYQPFDSAKDEAQRVVGCAVPHE